MGQKLDRLAFAKDHLGIATAPPPVQIERGLAQVCGLLSGKLFSEPLKTFLADDDVVAIAAQYRFEPAELVPANDYARRFSSSADLYRIFGCLAAFRRLPG